DENVGTEQSRQGRDAKRITARAVRTNRTDTAQATSSPNSTFQYARSMKCFQLSCWCRLKLIWTNGRHFGRLGLRMRCIPASWGVRLALSVLHSMHEQTMFSQDVGPPRSRGTT